MHPRTFVIGLVFVALVSAACGGGPRAATADLAAVRQPTPDPTLDAVVRDLPRLLAGVSAPTPTATPVVISAPTLKPTPVAHSPTVHPAARTTPATKPRP